ncbi:hypothetical protein AQUCO_05000023v1 [Aquilegia coerulea]|uniref:SWIM-type domain-containing protein n=1 Tax=Aquilegia coerulea TaxID=218851 RepID=A0A2G5CJ92_AQUCA|nr:hypothetical protein AQUCO_05000023v1 [Aquilegia coerulea]
MDNIEPENEFFEVNGQGNDMEEVAMGENVDESSKCDIIPQVPNDLKPMRGQEFSSLDEVLEFYNAYAKHAGFSVRKWAEKKNKNKEIIRKEYVCFKEGKCSIVEEVEKSRRRGSVREGYKARIVVSKSSNGKFVVTLIVEGHNHPLSTPRKTHLLRSHREVSSAHKCLSQQLSMVNIPTHQQYNFLGDLYNYNSDVRKELKGHDAEMFREYLKSEEEKNPSFTYNIDVDDEQRICRAFWADATSRRDYALYGDVVVFDTTYDTNRYKLILAPLMGVNNHGQTIIFGCAFLSDETISSFIWLLKQCLLAMPGDAPKMIITDQDPAMTNAIAQTLPSTFHRYCSWHILNKFSEKLDAVKYSVYYKEFYYCIWNSKSKEEFDLVSLELVQRSGLQDNKWLRSMFEIRLKWVPAYTKHVFSAEMTSSQRAESSHSFFKKYVGEDNSMVDFMVQFDRGLQKQRHEALIADNKDVIEKPKLKMLNDILVQMVDIYTNEIFYKFQSELLESFNYKFQLINETDTHICRTQRKNVEIDKGRQVSYEKDSDYVSCTCNKFESMYIPCRHVLAYLHKYTDFEKLPSHYILKRLKKSAKSETVIDCTGIEIVDNKSYFLERSRLIQCCLGVVNKALTSEEAKKVLIDSLCSAEEKINLLVDSGRKEKKTSSTCGKRTREVVDNVADAELAEQMNCEEVATYREPNQVRAKGSGKRIKGGKEKTLGSSRKAKGRLCKGCGERGVGHDVRTCPKVVDASLSQP